MALHTVAAPEVREAVKTELSYRNDMTVFSFAASKNKDNPKVALDSSNTSTSLLYLTL